MKNASEAAAITPVAALPQIAIAGDTGAPVTLPGYRAGTAGH